MSEANFADALRRLLAHEGGYSNHPADPGGPTKYGITIGDYRKYIKPDGTAADVRAMTIDEAKQIYRERYWNVLRCGELPSGVDYAVFDYGVNSGVARAGKVLRRVLSLGSSTATVTASVVSAAMKVSAQETVMAICDERLSFLKGLRTWPTFGTGWGRRVADVRAASLAMAHSAPAGAAAKRPNPKSEAAAAASVLGAVAAAVAAWMQSPAFWLVALAAAAVVAAGIFWFLRFRQKKETA